MTRGRGRRVFDMGRAQDRPLVEFLPDELLNMAAPPPPPPVRPIEFTAPVAITPQNILPMIVEMRRVMMEQSRRSFSEMEQMVVAAMVRQLDSTVEMEMRQAEDLRERRDKEMAKAPMNTVQLETGEQREPNRASRLFFVYVTPTGAELPISKCPGIKKEWGRTNGAFGSESRQTITEYTVTAPCTIKMVNLQSTFGRPKRVVNLMINIDPEAATIEVKGLEGFGMFKGRAKVLYDQSTYFLNREGLKLTEAVLKEHFGLRVLQPPVKGGGARNVRSLIFE